MCTAIAFQSKDHYFGRNLDFELSYQERVIITPRSYPFLFRHVQELPNHYAMIGMGIISKNYPLYFDATNEKGLSMAGLNFPGNAAYFPCAKNKTNVASFELIPWILGQCQNISEVTVLLENLNIADTRFSEAYPNSNLHWIIADKTGAITVEQTASGLHIYDNPVGVLTNNPTFDYHLYNLSNYLNLTSDEVSSRFSGKYQLQPYSRGMGAIGLPGDLSSASRFVRAAFTKLNSRNGPSESESISQFFHILGSVAQQNGCVKVGELYEKTIYSSCCNTDKGIYYYTTYENSQITAVSLFQENLDTKHLIQYPLITEQQIKWINQ